MEIIKDIDQGSDEWFGLRLGSVGASSVSKIITSTGKVSGSRKAYLYQLASEKITGQKTETFQSAAMRNGQEMESNTRQEFMLKTGLPVEQVAIIFPDGRPGWHISPDGLVVDEDAGVELKSVQPATQVKYLDKGTLPTDYILQCQMSLLVTGWPVWWFCSHCPGFEPLILPVKRDEALIEKMESELKRFVDDLVAIVQKVGRAA